MMLVCWAIIECDRKVADCGRVVVISCTTVETVSVQCLEKLFVHRNFSTFGKVTNKTAMFLEIVCDLFHITQ